MSEVTQMALGILAVVLLVAVILILVGPQVTPYSRKQWALLMATLIVLWIPMGAYLIFVVGTSKTVDQRNAILAGALNLGIGIPVFIFIVRKWILKR